MAYAPHYRVTFGGELDPLNAGAWDEVWQCNVNGTAAGTGDFPPDAWLNSVAADIKLWFGNAAQAMHPLSRISYLKVNAIGADGKYVDPSHPHTINFVPAAGAATSSGIPSFVSIATSWTTAKLRGPGHTGRIYTPNTVTSTGPGTDIISTGAQDAINASGKALLTLLSQSVSSWHLVPCIASKVDATNTPITGVRTGRVYDVQRRRKNKISEVYRSVSWP